LSLTVRLQKRAKTREIFVILAIAMVWLAFSGLAKCWARAGQPKVAIVRLKGVKPYIALGDVIEQKLNGRTTVKTFEISPGIEGSAVRRYLDRFDADVTVCVGKRAYQLCEQHAISPIVLAYNTNISVESNPFSLVRYLSSNAQKIAVILNEKGREAKDRALVAQGQRFGLKVKTKHTRAESLKQLAAENDAIALERGVLIVKGNSTTLKAGPTIAVFDGSIEVYKQLLRRCMSQLPKFDGIIDISKVKAGELKEKLVATGLSVVLCVGANSYQQCGFMKNRSQILIAVEADPIENDVEQWGTLSGVSMFANPKDCLDALGQLVKRPVIIAMPYNPENTELLVLRTLFEAEGKIEIAVLPVLNEKQAGKAITGQFDNYDGIWVIPDSTISVAAIQKFLLEKSLLEKKILVTMMHPYTKRGAMLAVSGVGGNTNELGERVVSLINEKLEDPRSIGKVVSPPASISLNVKTLRHLNYKIPQSLLNRAESIFGK